MKNKFTKTLFSVCGLLLLHLGAKSQVTLLQDYSNTNSPAIGTYQGINFREAGFSGLYPIPGTNGQEFWTHSDRGVNVDCANANLAACRPTYDKMYAFASYAPKIHRIKIVNGSVQILQTITIKTPKGTTATGIINPTGLGSTATEVASTDTVLDCTRFNLKTAAKDTFGIDPEGIIVDKAGNFWLCEEGGATIWKLNPNGVLLQRFTPFANVAGAQSIDIQIDTVFKYRKNNRGFEGISIAPNGKIYAIIQSPILYPNVTIGEGTRIHRILEIDPTTNAQRMITYLNDGIIGASGANQIRLRDWKIGDMAAINDSTFLVLEAAARGTTDIKRLYRINISGATAVHSGLYGTSTLEGLVDSTGLANNSIKPVTKTLVMDLLASGWPSSLDKAEGLAIINDSTIAICNDNDFGQTCPNADGIPIATTNTSHVITFRLSGANKLTNYTTPIPTSTANLDYSFVVLGCNRVEDVDSVGNPSTANVYQLNRVFTEITQMNPLPKYLFFAGDLVLGYEADTVKLANQLTNWLAIYNAHPIKNTSVQLVPIEGNHETQNKAAGKKSFVAAERTWQRIMANYIAGSNGPGITGLVAGTDSLTTDQSKLTYSFNYKNDHFVVVNTDPVGRDGMVAYKWIGADIAAARTKGARHIFAVGHKPAYTGHFKATPDGLENNITQRDSFWNILETQQADAFFSAHIHASDSIQPHTGKTFQVIAGNGGSLVEPTFTSFPNAYFGYVVVNVFNNDSVRVMNWGRDATMTLANYKDSTPNNPTTLRASYTININPTINVTPVANTLGNGPFTVVANITDNIAVTGALLNYKVNGISRTAITPSISGSTYTFVIPAEVGYGVISYTIQANDASNIKIYSTGAPTNYATFSFGALSQQGPSSSATPYIIPTAPGVKTTSILSVLDSASNYKMAGIPDGLGAFDNGNGTFTLLMNHELVNTVGAIRAHGSIGSFVSKWVINKSNLSVVSGSDLIQNVNLYDTTSKTYSTYNSSNPSTKAAFGRFCSADLPPVSAFYNSTSGKGTQERIFMNGEETNDESRAFAHIVTGTNAGTSWELPALGKGAWENAVASPNTGDKTVVALTNDGTDGQVYFYIGTKTTTGTEIDKAGLNNGKPFGVSVSGFAVERTSTTSNIPLPAAGTRFMLTDLGNVTNMSGVAFNTASNTAGVTKFSRPEDGAWDPSNPRDFYFNTTDQIDQVLDGVGTQIGRSRVWRLRFDSIAKPELGGTIEAVLDGTEGQNMLDNMAIDKFGHILLQEDVGNAAHNGKMWQYTIATDKLIQLAKHDSTRFGDIGVAATAPFNQDEETSGIIDVSDILGQGMFLTSDQAHYAISGAAVEGGQLLSFFNPDTYNASLGAGPNSSATPYILPIKSGVTLTSILTTPDSISGGYKMAGTPDGLGAFDNGNGTFTLLMNHEFVNTVGTVRAHGAIGSFVSKWVINKNDLSVVSGGDLIKKVNLWNGTGYTLYNPTDTTSKKAFGRFCSADLPPVSAFYNAASGKGTQERIFMNGEETNDESRAFAHIVTGANEGTTYELPFLGKAAWENGVACPASKDTTIVALTNDGTDGQVYFYIGTKTTTGTEIDKAGLSNGRPYGIKVTGFSKERVNSTTVNPLPVAGTRFTLVDVGSVENMTGAAFNTASNTAGITSFSRPEDGAWDPIRPNDFYFNTTDQLDQVADGVGTQVGRSKVWRVRFDDITKPSLGGTIEAVVDGTEGINMLDNMAIDNYGHIILNEDVGNAAHNGKVWQYTIATDQLTLLAKHDPARFGDIGVAATAPFTIDEETSGTIDAEAILGKGKFLMVDQAHYAIAGEAVEGGQLMVLFNPDTYNGKPLMTIGAARSLTTSNDTVKVRGVVTRAWGRFIYIQDATGAIGVRQASGAMVDSITAGSLKEGDSVEVVGAKGEFNNYAQLQLFTGAFSENSRVTKLASNIALPTPIVLTLKQINTNGEQYESKLVRVVNVKTSSTGAFAPSTNYTIWDGTTPGDTMLLRVIASQDTEIDDAPASNIPAGSFTFEGTLIQFCSSPVSGCTLGYQLQGVRKKEIIPQLNAFSLVTPVTNTRVVTTSTNTNNVNFVWNKSLNATTYKWFITNAAGTYTTPWLSSASTTNGTDTTFSYANNLFDTLAAKKGILKGDSVQLKWTVYAYLGSDSLVATQSNNIWIVREKPVAPPVLSAFNLLAPANNARVEVAQGSTTPIVINWTKSTNAIQYKWFLTTSSGNFTSPIVSYPSNNSGADSLLTLTSGSVDGMLASMNVTKGDSVNLKWTVYAYRTSTDSLKASQDFTIKLVRKRSLQTFNLLSPANNVRLEVDQNETTPIVVTWSSSASVATYKWMLDASSGNFTTPWSVMNADNNGTDTKLTLTAGVIDSIVASKAVVDGDSVTLKWIVRAYETNDSLQSAQTFNLLVVRKTNVGLNETNLNTFAKLYPNPTSGNSFLSFTLQQAEQLHISVTDLQGKEVLSPITFKANSGINELELPTSEIKSGIYFISLDSNGKSDKIKLVVIH